MSRHSKSRLFLAIAAAAALAAVVVAAEEGDGDEQIEEEDHILVLNSKNFDKATKEYQQLLVEWYSPSCGHCKALEPEYKQAAKSLADKGAEVRLAMVNAMEASELAKRFEIRGFPTLKYFKHGAIPRDYQGPRKAEALVTWLEKRGGAAAKVISTVSEAEKMIEDQEVVVVGFFDDLDCEEAKEYMEAADKVDEAFFLLTSEADVRKHYSVGVGDKTLVLFKDWDERRVVYDGDMAKSEDIKEWAATHAVPLVNEFSQDSAMKIFGGSVKTFFFLVISKEAENFEASLEALKPAAREMRGKMIFVYLDPDSDENEKALEFFGVEDPEEDLPLYMIMEMEKNAKFMSGKNAEVDADKVKEFCNKHQAGTLRRTLKQQEAPQGWDKKPVKILTTENYDAFVNDKSKDVLVLIYAPWCGHCKSILPIWNKLGKKYKDSEAVDVAKMDGTENELEDVALKGFPTIKLYRKETNEILDYSSPQRKLEDFVKFIETGEQETPTPDTDATPEDHDEL